MAIRFPTTHLTIFNASAPTLSLARPFSLSVWLRPDFAAEPYPTYSGIFTDGGSYFYLTQGKPLYYDGGNTAITTAALTQGQWTHIVYDINATACRIYINGGLSVTGSAASADPTLSRIGWGSAGEIYRGEMADFLLVTGSLSGSEARGLYNRTLRPEQIRRRRLVHIPGWDGSIREEVTKLNLTNHAAAGGQPQLTKGRGPAFPTRFTLLDSVLGKVPAAPAAAVGHYYRTLLRRRA